MKQKKAGPFRDLNPLTGDKEVVERDLEGSRFPSIRGCLSEGM